MTCVLLRIPILYDWESGLTLSFSLQSSNVNISKNNVKNSKKE